MEESASGGRMSTRELEWRCRATEEDGFSSSRFKVDSTLRATLSSSVTQNYVTILLLHAHHEYGTQGKG